jgi:four helix bundle protein
MMGEASQALQSLASVRRLFLTFVHGTNAAQSVGVFTYRDLDAWKRSMSLVESCYRATAGFPKSELYGLTSQVRRAAVSIPSNVAEGHCRRSTKVFLNHVSIALGSQAELETCIELGARLSFLSPPEKENLSAHAASVGRLLNGLYRSLETKLQSEAVRVGRL